MPCYHPIPAWYSNTRNESGKRSLVFRPESGAHERRQTAVPCGRCIGCRLERARQWAVRCMHESLLHEENCFVTLTYGPEDVPENGSLRPDDFVGFMKRLRWHCGNGIRFFQCGEYGDTLGRPHHHALLFNWSFKDRKFYKDSNGKRLYESKQLNELWGYGDCLIGDVTFESAGYIARYTSKKVIGEGAEKHYGGRVPEYLTMSRRPGIGRGFVEEYRKQMYAWDTLIVRGRKCKPPRYYDDVAAKVAPSVVARVKARRRVDAAASVDNSGSRLVVRETVKKGAISNLRR